MKFKLNSEACSGCRVCQVICSLVHFKEVNHKKGALKIFGHFPEPGSFSINVCTQCGECAKVCPTNAITKEGEAYIINRTLCIKCGACKDVCPYNVIVFDEIGFPIKCDNCGECIKICPRAALMDEEGGIKNDIRL
ncbi:4Fe-4S binding protein [Thermovenabulum gondwanense]|uniref:NADH-dependent phenylglyoxylate dehydrogenase subunit beta n=1 Tax=Thermovenabulum gondwanense TaxID=520767 RepID=A0A162N0A3_9FIRM|nr:4Fe-4S binding protein [Thermovenabulum gondwanense]KYO68625.1 NADH-dependent phenylglyoxylate dehydrogenase subunit beta [Thermovenabulum gondwanense]